MLTTCTDEYVRHRKIGSAQGTCLLEECCYPAKCCMQQVVQHASLMHPECMTPGKTILMQLVLPATLRLTWKLVAEKRPRHKNWLRLTPTAMKQDKATAAMPDRDIGQSPIHRPVGKRREQHFGGSRGGVKN